RRGFHGYFVWMTTVEASGALTVSMALSRYPKPPVSARARSSENLTSADVITLPFENLTLGRRWNVHESWSVETSTLVANHGSVNLPSFEVAYSVSNM